jgi:hypothetical protein
LKWVAAGEVVVGSVGFATIDEAVLVDAVVGCKGIAVEEVVVAVFEEVDVLETIAAGEIDVVVGIDFVTLDEAVPVDDVVGCKEILVEEIVVAVFEGVGVLETIAAGDVAVGCSRSVDFVTFDQAVPVGDVIGCKGIAVAEVVGSVFEGAVVGEVVDVVDFVLVLGKSKKSRS